MWNEVPGKVKNQKTMNAFKTAYDKWKTKNILPETADAAIATTDDEVFAS